MSKHTPGPWNKDAIYWLLRYSRRTSGRWDNEEIWQGKDSMNMPNEEDANLIAAAPELLEVAKLALEMDSPEDATALFNMATKAIAKAKGEEK